MSFNSPVSRRNFMRESAVAIGAGTLIGAQRNVHAQEPKTCAPPKPPGGAVPFKPNTALTVRARRSGATLTANEVTRLRAAYRALRDLQVNDPSDPRGWMHQANVHCWNCGGGLN